jgi:Tfp pilus assembly protein PilO
MLKSFNLKGIHWREPRVMLRAVLGVLLAANLAAAVVAFKPFGGSAEDLRREQDTLQRQLQGLQKQVAASQRLAAKVHVARDEGDRFLDKYFAPSRMVASTIQGELFQMAKDSGVVYLPTAFSVQQIEGSDTLEMMTINTNCQGTYAALSKFVNLLDRSDRFLIVESMSATPQQTGQNLNVTLKVDTFVKESPGEAQ